ncbi:diguanylate cyclase domain-containing protein, partial [Stutzerimonas kunmingensis]|uniref:diguanylate cyclase domain-containing protein n=2 Tax=Stutzerimonas kunmingensis TaxID=1211807 RepID=UPI00289B8F68
MPLLLLADRPEWAERLRACLQGSHGKERLIIAADWDTASAYLETPCLLLATPECQALAERFPWPLILLLDDEPTQMPEGAVDWLVGDQLSAEVLRRCLRYVRERCNLQGTLQRLAEQDPHTGIVNRQGFQALLFDALAEHQEQDLVLGYLDLDNFRHVNDALGHQAGDRLILQVVARLKAQLEVGDMLARLGGD